MLLVKPYILYSFIKQIFKKMPLELDNNDVKFIHSSPVMLHSSPGKDRSFLKFLWPPHIHIPKLHAFTILPLLPLVRGLMIQTLCSIPNI